MPTIPAGVLAQAWRGGPQPLLSRFLDATASDVLDEAAARGAGTLLANAGRGDVVDANVVVGALRRGDAVVTGDRDDLTVLAEAAGRRLAIITI
ncbi:MAG TPA: hypothetical protein VHC43_04670 [Mycobacteriales bacterium]|nr:hypothetical protein [Mycobacteriales bacterium]